MHVSSYSHLPGDILTTHTLDIHTWHACILLLTLAWCTRAPKCLTLEAVAQCSRVADTWGSEAQPALPRCERERGKGEEAAAAPDTQSALARSLCFRRAQGLSPHGAPEPRTVEVGRAATGETEEADEAQTVL